MHTTKVLVKFTTHTSHICVDDRGYIHVFKYNARTCDFDCFKENDQYSASDYIQAPLPTIYYSVTFPTDDQI